jgi:cytochrome c-type biogenesis protein CcmH
MIAFWAISAMFVAGALLFVMPPLLARRESSGFSRSAANLAIHRDELRELDAEKRAGTLDAEQYARARRELETRLLEDVAQSDAPPVARRRARAPAIVTGLAIPLLAFALYFIVGNPYAILNGGAAESAAHGLNPQQVQALVDRLATRMKSNPDHPEGWILLGRSYGAFGRFGEAAEAYANAVQRLPDDARLLADYADALAMAQGRLQGEPEVLIARSLAADPRNVKALALAGSAAFERKDYPAAIRNWEQILPLVPPESQGARSTLANIAEARALGGAERQAAPR